MRKILIVEDELIIARVYRMFLEFNGFEVTGIAITFQQALELFKENEPDLVIMDVHLAQNTSGIEAAREIRKISNATIIFTTGIASDEMDEVLLEINNSDVLIKPIENEMLLQMVTSKRAIV